MGKMTKRIASVALALVMTLSVLCCSVFAATPENVKHYNYYTAIGDSIGSGFGQPDYNKQGKMVIWGQRIEGAYPSWVADWTGAKLCMRQMPGYTTAALRYELDDSFKMHDWEVHELSNFTYGAYDKEFLDNMKSDFRNNIKKSDLITLDIGVNDTWYSTIALIYYIAEYANTPSLKFQADGGRGLLGDELKKYGTWGTVVRNALAYLDGFATNPTQWAHFWALWGQNVASYLTSFQQNYDAIVKAIFKINPKVTVVGVGGYNSFKYLKILPTDGQKFSVKITSDGKEKTITLADGSNLCIPGYLNFYTGVLCQTPQTMYDLYNAIRESYVNVYPGQYFYADTQDTELIGQGLHIPLYENSSMDDSSYNPHPTAAGHKYMATQIVAQLPSRS